MSTDSSDSSGLLRRAGQGDATALGRLLETHRKRLRRMVRLRLDPRLQGRIDPSDVLQETYLEAAERLAEYLRDPKMPFFLWLRFLTGQKLLELRRHHLGTQARDAARELSIYQGAMPEASSACLAAQLLGKRTAPRSRHSRRDETAFAGSAQQYGADGPRSACPAALRAI